TCSCFRSKRSVKRSRADSRWSGSTWSDECCTESLRRRGPGSCPCRTDRKRNRNAVHTESAVVDETARIRIVARQNAAWARISNAGNERIDVYGGQKLACNGIFAIRTLFAPKAGWK